MKDLSINEYEFSAWLSKMILEKHDEKHIIKLCEKKLRQMKYIEGKGSTLRYGVSAQKYIYNK